MKLGKYDRLPSSSVDFQFGNFGYSEEPAHSGTAWGETADSSNSTWPSNGVSQPQPSAPPDSSAPSSSQIAAIFPVNSKPQEASKVTPPPPPGLGSIEPHGHKISRSHSAPTSHASSSRAKSNDVDSHKPQHTQGAASQPPPGIPVPSPRGLPYNPYGDMQNAQLYHPQSYVPAAVPPTSGAGASTATAATGTHAAGAPVQQPQPTYATPPPGINPYYHYPYYNPSYYYGGAQPQYNYGRPGQGMYQGPRGPYADPYAAAQGMTGYENMYGQTPMTGQFADPNFGRMPMPPGAGTAGNNSGNSGNGSTGGKGSKGGVAGGTGSAHGGAQDHNSYPNGFYGPHDMNAWQQYQQTSTGWPQVIGFPAGVSPSASNQQQGFPQGTQSSGRSSGSTSYAANSYGSRSTPSAGNSSGSSNHHHQQQQQPQQPQAPGGSW